MDIICPCLWGIICHFRSECYFHYFHFRTNGSNWVVNAIDSISKKPFSYQINVCHSLLYFTGLSGTQCEGAGACQTVGSNVSTFVSLGQIRSPRIVNGDIWTLYSSPSTSFVTNCSNGFSPKIRIDFVCKPGSLGAPVYQLTTATCVYLFVWETSAACSTTSIQGQNCQVTDPTSGLTFDMSPLSSSDYTFASTSGNQYTVHVCGAAKACGGTYGGCVTINGVTQSLGLPNSNLTYTDSSLFINLAKGASCGNGNQRSVNIQFACNPSAGVGQPVFVVDDGCMVTARWETSSACASREQIPCVFTDPATGLTYDLSALSNSESNFFAIDNSSSPSNTTLYALSVCHSLLSSPLTQTCNATAGICEVNGTLAQSTNFGSVSSLKVVNGVLTAQYTNGDACGPQSTPISANISFTCNTNPSLQPPLGLYLLILHI